MQSLAASPFRLKSWGRASKSGFEKTVLPPTVCFTGLWSHRLRQTTLHSILKFLNTPDTKIWTAEDPVEITQKGLRQVQINKSGNRLCVGRARFCGPTPDTIMVGESRDKETVFIC
jgi:hypothetical protein